MRKLRHNELKRLTRMSLLIRSRAAWSSLVAQWVKDLMSLLWLRTLLWHRFQPWSLELPHTWGSARKKKKKVVLKSRAGIWTQPLFLWLQTTPPYCFPHVSIFLGCWFASITITFIFHFGADRRCILRLYTSVSSNRLCLILVNFFKCFNSFC